MGGISKDGIENKYFSQKRKRGNLNDDPYRTSKMSPNPKDKFFIIYDGDTGKRREISSDKPRNVIRRAITDARKHIIINK